MGKRKVQVIILCEDKQQEVFARHFLTKSGFEPRKIRVLPLPDGKQSGEQYVRETYPEQVQLYRGKSTYLSCCLIVVIDADKYSVKQRLDSLDSALEEKNVNLKKRSQFLYLKEILKLGYLISKEKLLMRKLSIQNWRILEIAKTI